MASASNLPESYNTFQLPDLILSHHPESSPTVTPVVIIKLHRPRERNAFTDRLGNSLMAAYDALSADPRVRCIVLASSDPAGAVFCAGMDLHDQINTDVPQADYRDIGGIVGLAMERCKKPIIAANASIVSARVMRDLILRSPSTPEEAHLLESKLFWDLFRGRDTKEGIDSFMQKRQPDFKGTIDEDAPTHYPWWQALNTRTKVRSKI